MEQKYILGIVALTMVVILGISMISAFGFGKGFMNFNLTDEEKAEMQLQRQSIQTAIVENNYTAWKSLMEERIAKMQSQLTEENFNKIVEQNKNMSEFKTAMQEARESGNFSKVKELKAQYGIESGFGRGHFRMR